MWMAMNERTMAERGLLTDREREIISGEADVEDNYRYRTISRVRNKIGRIGEDAEILSEHRADLLDELCEAVQINPRLADGIKAYVAVKDYEKTGKNEILFEGEPISRIAAGGGEDKVSWGHAGSGPQNTARSILEHAKEELEMKDSSVVFNSTHFQNDFIRRQEGSYWAIPLSQVRNWMEHKIEQKEEKNN